jgi:uncharacterized membrane protein
LQYKTQRKVEFMNQNLLYGIVLLSAVGHASWNALLKRTSDRLVMMVAIRIVGLFYGFILLWYAGTPSIESLKWVTATVVAMWVYQGMLVQGYHAGDLSFIYPLARGLAPVLLTGFAFLLIDETISVPQLWGVICISLGILTLSLLGHGSRLALIYATLIGTSVAAYSLLGGAGVRLSGNLFGFSAALEIVSGMGVLAYASVTRGRSFLSSVLAIWPTGIGAGLFVGRGIFDVPSRRNSPPDRPRLGHSRVQRAFWGIDRHLCYEGAIWNHTGHRRCAGYTRHRRAINVLMMVH